MPIETDHVHTASFDSSRELQNDKTTIVASRSLLVVVKRPPDATRRYKEFEKRVNQRNERAPFFFPGGSSLLGPKKLTVFASYLYDGNAAGFAFYCCERKKTTALFPLQPYDFTRRVYTRRFSATAMGATTRPFIKTVPR